MLSIRSQRSRSFSVHGPLVVMDGMPAQEVVTDGLLHEVRDLR